MQAQIFLKPFIGEMFTYKKHSIHRNYSAMVINMVTDIKQTCLGQGLGVTFTARKHPSKLMFTMKDLGHTLLGRQFNFNRAGSHALHACADPEHFVRGGSERGPKCH